MSYPIEMIRHSLAHVMAAAVKKLWPEAKFAGGPAIENGFYYDFDTEHRFSEEDFAAVEREMRGLIKSDGKFVRREVSPSEARGIFRGQPYKTEWLEGYGDSGEPLSVYDFRGFTDLCKGPHVASSQDLPKDGFKLRTVAGAYWKGDSKNKMLQRIYCDAFATADELAAHLRNVEEAEKRDHKKIGPALDLFFFDPRSPGAPYLLPNGLIVYKELLRFWSIDHEERGYQEFRKPLMNRKELYETSGHWDHYRDDMFIMEEGENNAFALSPMSCPNAIVAYQRESRSYNDLPLRLSDSDMLYRHESSGALNGLFRTYEFNQDDAHIFISEDMIEAEYGRILDIVKDYYDLFGIKARISLSTRPDSFIGDIGTWDAAESILKKIMTERFGKDGFEV
ncbi:MAG: threonine--tRNA ligase, partial [Rickettsiales bacterium]|nr:threonine--tRNA ligase [Rickettsiales bacterium]